MPRALQALVLPGTLALSNAERSCGGCRPHGARVCPPARARKGGEVWGAPYGVTPGVCKARAVGAVLCNPWVCAATPLQIWAGVPLCQLRFF